MNGKPPVFFRRFKTLDDCTAILYKRNSIRDPAGAQAG